MLVAVLAFFFLPWLDRSPVKSIRYRGWLFKVFLALFTVSLPRSHVPGAASRATGIYVTAARVLSIGYFAFFVLMPWYSRWDQVKPVPERVSLPCVNPAVACSSCCVFALLLTPTGVRGRRRGREGRAGRLGELARRQRRQQSRLAAARRAQFHELLHWLPFTEVRALLAHGGRSENPDRALQANLIPPGSNALDYIKATSRRADAPAWFGKVPPDLSLIARSKGADYVYRFLQDLLRGSDPSDALPTTCADPSPAMPAVLSELEGVKTAVFRE